MEVIKGELSAKERPEVVDVKGEMLNTVIVLEKVEWVVDFYNRYHEQCQRCKQGGESVI
jgi:hypothetical protein